MTELQDSSNDLPRLELVARVSPQGFALREIRRKFGTRTMRIAFTPELNLTNAKDSIATEVNFEVDEGDHRRVTHGVVTIESREGVKRLHWSPRSPSWTKTQELTSTIKTEANGYVLEVSQLGGQTKR